MPPSRSSAQSVSPPPVILLVEDDQDTVDMYATHLHGAGYWVATAQNGEDGCRTFDELKPDIVITDLGMPARSDGLELIEHVAQHGSRRVPVILVTGHDRGSIPHAAAAKVTAILMKPVLPALLELEVRRTLSRAREMRDGPCGDGECPSCHKALAGSQRRSDPNYDYFDPCPSGCGRFFRHRSSGRYYRLP